MNDIPDAISSSIAKMFADDSKVYNSIVTTTDCDALQADLNALAACMVSFVAPRIQYRHMCARCCHSYTFTPMCVRMIISKFTKKGCILKVCRRTQMYTIFSKKVLFDDDVLATWKKGYIFMWFSRMWNPRNLTICCLIYSRFTQVLVIVELFYGRFCPKIFENIAFQVSVFVYMKCGLVWWTMN